VPYQVEENEIGRACSVRRGDEKYYAILVVNPKGKRTLRINFKLCLRRKIQMESVIEFIWLQVGTSGGLV
jgi:hypothetical protein